MSQTYSQELRADTSRIIIPSITVATILVGLIFTVRSTAFWEVWHMWLIVVVSPLGGWISWRYITTDRAALGSFIFLFVQSSFLTILLVQEWQPGSALPYLFGVLIVTSAMLNRAESGFFVWGASVFVLFFVANYREGLAFEAFLLVLAPIFINFCLAGVAFLSAVEWQYAVETVSDLHISVQRRRDELFGIQEEVKWANARLEASNEQIEFARQAAVNERDIRTRFMNHVSHELRTPLNSIVNFAHILRLGGRGGVSEGQIDYLERIEKSGWHLLSVLNDLLDMAQIQAGEFNLHMEVCKLDAICEEAMTTARGLILESQIDLIRDYPAEWPFIYIDKMRIKQALINLLGNAVKYTEQGYIALRIKVEDSFLHLTVEDSGIGIPTEHFETIFKEFRQVNESDARQRVGTGLGLPITKHLIERHGGEISLESEVGKGSVFMISLPIVQPEAVTTSDTGELQLLAADTEDKEEPAPA